MNTRINLGYIFNTFHLNDRTRYTFGLTYRKSEVSPEILVLKLEKKIVDRESCFQGD